MAPISIVAISILAMILTTYDTSATDTQTFFKRIEYNSVYDNCESPLKASSAMLCARWCAAGGIHNHTCIGINFTPIDGSQNVHKRNGNPGFCQLCLATKSVSFVQPVAPNKKSFMAYAHNDIRNPSDWERFLDLKSGLYDGQILTFKFVPNEYHAVIMFLTKGKWLSDDVTQNSDCNLKIGININPNYINMDNFRAGSTHWEQDIVRLDASDYFALGKEYELVIIVTQLNYFLFVDGKPMVSYPRPTHTPLEDIRYLRLKPQMSMVWFLPPN